MDAAQTNLKKISFFLATALLLTVPFQASAAATLGASQTSVTIGSSSCNSFQTVTLASSAGSATPIPFSVAVQYSGSTPTTGDANGNWLYTTISGSGTTSTGTPFTSTTGTSGVTLTIGLNRSIGSVTDTASVVVTDTSNSTDVVTITVFYAQNTSCGGNTGSTSNGFISVTPGNIALTAATNGQQSQTVTIQDTTGSPMTFGYSVSPSSSWLSVTANSTTIAANGTTSINVTGDATKTGGANTYNGILTIQPQSGFGNALNIPVVFTVTSGTTTGGGGGSGTLTINGASNTSYTTSFNYVAPTTPGGECIPIQDTAAGANSYTSAVTTTSGGNWLLANNQLNTTTLQLLAPSNSACINLSLSNAATTLGSGAYQGQVLITSSSGSTATLYVNLYISAGSAPGITVSPGLIFVFNNVASASSVQQQQVFSITAAPGYSTSLATLSGGGNGFSMTTPVASNNTQTFTITSNSSGLTTGVYSTTVTMQSSANGSTNTTTITIVLPVGQSGSTTTGNNTGTTSVAPLTLAFEQQLGSGYWTSQKEAQSITITGASGTSWNAGIVYASGSGWLTFDSASTGTFGNTPATLTVDLSNGVTSLAASSTPYQATISIMTPNGTTTVSVSLLVTPSNTPVLLGSPASATFSATTGNSTPTQTVSIVGSDNTSSSTSPPIVIGTPTATWLTATGSGNSMTLSVNSTGQTTGVYSATVPVSASAYGAAGPINFPVVMIVNGGGNGTGTGGNGPLQLSTTSMSFSNVTGQITQNLNVTANTSTSFTVSSSENSCLSASWLQVINTSYTATTTATPVSVTVIPGSIANGITCTGVITLVSTGSNGGTQTVNVSMTVGASSSGGNVTVSPTTMTFAYTQNQAVPAAQVATIVNAASGTASINFTVATTETNGTSVTWLQTNVTSASTPYNSPGLSVSVAPGNLTPGTYTGTVTITPTGGTAVPISVTMTITGTAVVSATASGGGTNMSLSYIVGGNSPTSTVLVSGGGSTAGFTATATSTPSGWLVVSPTTGTTPNSGTFNLAVSVAPAVLATMNPSPTAYTGTITVQGTSPATGSTIINVSLSISAPLPTITGVTNAASGATGAVSPGEIISIYGDPSKPIGPATSVKLDSTTCPSPCTSVPTTMGGVRVKFLPGGQFAPLLFVNQGQINAVVPYGVAGQAGLSVQVVFLNQTSNVFSLGQVATAPGLFTANASGTGQIAANQYDNQGNFQNVNLPSTPAKAGWTLVLYMTGEGSVSPTPADGAVTVYNSLANPPVPVPLVVPHVLINNQPATVSFYGEAPGLVSGVMQLNVLVPAGAGTGSATISVSLGTAATQAGATVSLQ